MTTPLPVFSIHGGSCYLPFANRAKFVHQREELRGFFRAELGDGIVAELPGRPIPTIVLFFLLTVAGILSFQKLPINANPNVSFPIVSVSVSQAGASPEELENSVTRRVESAISGMTGVRHITSTITEGSSSTMVEFQLGVDSDRAVNDVRNAITQIRDELPQSISNPIVERVDMEGGALAYYAVQSPDMNQTELSFFIDETVSRKLLAQPGVQQVKRLGGEKQEIRVALKPERLNALGITAEQVSQQLAQTNANIPAGRTQLNNLEQSVRVLGSRADLRALAELPCPTAARCNWQSWRILPTAMPKCAASPA